MRAVVITEPGGPDVLQVADVPDVEPGPGEIRVAIAATAVNRADTSQRRGTYPPPPGAPEYPGLECSGTVDVVGAGVERWQVGDEVCALLAGGGYAGAVVVDARHALPRPAGVSVEDAAALPEAACTVWYNLVHRAGLRAGESVLVHGGSSGIGTTAIQLARAMGATVLCTVGSREKADACAELGAGTTILYRDEDFVERVAEVTDGRGVDVVLDIVGADYLERNLAALAPDGRLACVGMQSGTRSTVDLGPILRRRLSVTGSTLRAQSDDAKAEIVAAVEREVWPYVEAGRVRPVIDSRLDLTEAATAHRIIEGSEHIGKILLRTAG